MRSITATPRRDRATFRVYVEGAPSAFGAPGLTLLRIGVKGKRLGREEQRPAMLTFLLDTSGSMAQPDRIGRARMALRLLLDQLAPADKLQIVSFDDKARVVLPPTPAPEEGRSEGLRPLQCNGSTNLRMAMRRAYEQAGRGLCAGRREPRDPDFRRRGHPAPTMRRTSAGSGKPSANRA